MSQIPLWGTGIGPGGTILARRQTAALDRRITADGSVRIVDVLVADTVPAYFQTDPSAADGPIPFSLFYRTNPWQPKNPQTGAAQGGESLFAYAYLGFSWSMAAAIRVSATVDGDAGDLVFPDGSILQNVPSSFALAQQPGSLQRLTQVFTVPLVRRKVDVSGNEVARWFLRGERLQIAIETTGPLGVGELMLESIEVEFDPLRKAIYPAGVTTQ